MHTIHHFRLKRSSLPLLLALAGMLAVLVMAACGAAGSTQVPTPTATPNANAILQQAASQTYTDATFDLTLGTVLSGQQVNGTGNGAINTSPQRAQVTLTLPVTVAGKTTTIKIETFSDYATNTLYTRTTTNGVVGRWTKTKLTGSSNSSSSSTSVDVTGLTNLNSFGNVKLIGAETVDSIPVWHLQAVPGTASASTPTATTTGTAGTVGTPTKTPTKTPTVSAASATKTAVAGATQTALNNATTVDIFVRKDNSYPYRIASHVALSSVTTDVALTFTKFNSGVTITLPKV